MLYGVVVAQWVVGLAACRRRPTTAFVVPTGGSLHPQSLEAKAGRPFAACLRWGYGFFYFVEPGTNNSLRKAVASGA